MPQASHAFHRSRPLRLQLLFPAALALMAATARGAEVTVESLLAEMTDNAALASYPAPDFKAIQASSTDRASVRPDLPGWFGNDDRNNYLRDEIVDGRTERVMMEADGPGAIVRMWVAPAPPKAGTLRIYLDGQLALTFGGFDVLKGGLNLPMQLLWPHPGYSDFQGGSTLYFPIPYGRSCKVTWQEGSQAADRCYEIGYRVYPPGTPVRTFTPADLEKDAALIRRTGELLAEPPAPAGTQMTLDEAIAAGQSISLPLPAGPQAVRALSLKLGSAEAALTARELRSVIVKLEFDGQPTVWCPATDFFGSGVGINPLTSYYRTVKSDGLMECRWVMPYQEKATITLQNLGPAPVRAALAATLSPWSWDARSMHFHAAWHHESGLQSEPPRDWSAMRIGGKGIYVGDTLSLFNPEETWYGEGDERIYVDGEARPSHLGTGTEDYYGYSYAPRGVIQSPFINQVRSDGKVQAEGHNVLTRTRNLDGITFQQKLAFDWELASWRPTQLTYAFTSYWYALPGSATAQPSPQPEAATAPIPSLGGR